MEEQYFSYKAVTNEETLTGIVSALDYYHALLSIAETITSPLSEVHLLALDSNAVIIYADKEMLHLLSKQKFWFLKN